MVVKEGRGVGQKCLGCDMRECESKAKIETGNKNRH